MASSPLPVNNLLLQQIVSVFSTIGAGMGNVMFQETLLILILNAIANLPYNTNLLIQQYTLQFSWPIFCRQFCLQITQSCTVDNTKFRTTFFY